jgi:dihydroneopterin aldolase
LSIELRREIPAAPLRKAAQRFEPMAEPREMREVDTKTRPAENADAVFVRGIELEANHGYTEEERESTRRFRLSLEMRTPLLAASETQRLSDTVDYRRVCEVATRIATQSTFQLLEGLAGAIGRAIQELYPRVEVIITLDKLAPSCPGVPESCGVRLRLPPATLPA